MPTRIVQISDLHCPARDPAQAAALVAAIAAAAPDVVAVTGDLTRRGRRHEFEIAAALVAALPGDKLVVPGNHDVPLIADRFNRPFARFARFFPDMPLFLETPEVFVIGLNTSIGLRLDAWDWSLGMAPEERVAPVAGLLREARGGRLGVVACHHPLRPHALDLRRSATEGGAQAFAELAAAGMGVLLHGHLHRAGKTCVRIGDAEVCEIVADTALSDRARSGSAGFNILDVSRTGWRAMRVCWTGDRYDVAAAIEL